MAKHTSDHSQFIHETGRLAALLATIGSLEPVHQKLVAEIVQLRLAILVENHLKRAFCKICCGASYIDGTPPVLLARQPSQQTAESQMKSLNRRRPINLKWNDSASIRSNVEHIVSPNDHCMKTIPNYGNFLADLRFIRNNIAHKNNKSRINYQKVVRRLYGANLNSLSCGTLLLSKKQSPNVLEQQVRTSRAMFKDLLRA